MRLGVVIDNFSELLYCPKCGRIKVISISEEHNKDEDIKSLDLNGKKAIME